MDIDTKGKVEFTASDLTKAARFLQARQGKLRLADATTNEPSGAWNMNSEDTARPMSGEQTARPITVPNESGGSTASCNIFVLLVCLTVGLIYFAGFKNDTLSENLTTSSGATRLTITHAPSAILSTATAICAWAYSLMTKAPIPNPFGPMLGDGQTGTFSIVPDDRIDNITLKILPRVDQALLSIGEIKTTTPNMIDLVASIDRKLAKAQADLAQANRNRVWLSRTLNDEIPSLKAQAIGTAKTCAEQEKIMLKMQTSTEHTQAIERDLGESGSAIDTACRDLEERIRRAEMERSDLHSQQGSRWGNLWIPFYSNTETYEQTKIAFRQLDDYLKHLKTARQHLDGVTNAVRKEHRKYTKLQGSVRVLNSAAQRLNVPDVDGKAGCSVADVLAFSNSYDGTFLYMEEHSKLDET